MGGFLESAFLTFFFFDCFVYSVTLVASREYEKGTYAYPGTRKKQKERSRRGGFERIGIGGRGGRIRMRLDSLSLNACRSGNTRSIRQKGWQIATQCTQVPPRNFPQWRLDRLYRDREFLFFLSKFSLRWYFARALRGEGGGDPG